MTTGSKAVFVISWSQTEAEGCRPVLPGALVAGASWRWSGEALRVDAPRDILLLEGAVGMAGIRRGAARMVGRLIGAVPGAAQRAVLGAARGAAQGRALGAGARPDGARPAKAALPGGGPDLADQSFVLSDGVRSWTAMVLGAAAAPAASPGEGGDADPGARGLLLAFPGAMPPRDRDLWVVRSRLMPVSNSPTGGVICFTAGTAIRTPDGVRAVESLGPGDLVLTRDNGPREVLWAGRRHMSGARLHAMPHLRPVRLCAGALGQGRPEGDLLVSPSHRILMRGAQARALFNADEVLVRAADLIDDHGIRTDLALREVTYHHILLEKHEILFANGVEADSFHPGEADPAGLEQEDHRRLLDLLPAFGQDPMGYGGFARRLLNAPEAALLCHRPWV